MIESFQRQSDKKYNGTLSETIFTSCGDADFYRNNVRQTRMNSTDLHTYTGINKKEDNTNVSAGLADCEIGMINRVIERKPMTEQKEG